MRKFQVRTCLGRGFGGFLRGGGLTQNHEVSFCVDSLICIAQRICLGWVRLDITQTRGTPALLERTEFSWVGGGRNAPFFMGADGRTLRRSAPFLSVVLLPASAIQEEGGAVES